MGRAAEVIAEPRPWDAEAESWLAKLCEDEPGGLAELASEVRAGRCDHWAIFEDGARVGSFVTRIDTMAEGARDFVITHAAARAATPIVESLLPSMEFVAWSLGCSRMRLHTSRPGMAEKLRRQGYGLPETVHVKRRPDEF
ncbi:MAG: hypothetical protein ACFB13_21215 [Kiloniellaceae bacterium]